jgi:hypothetical protein
MWSTIEKNNTTKNKKKRSLYEKEKPASGNKDNHPLAAILNCTNKTQPQISWRKVYGCVSGKIELVRICGVPPATREYEIYEKHPILTK